MTNSAGQQRDGNEAILPRQKELQMFLFTVPFRLSKPAHASIKPHQYVFLPKGCVRIGTAYYEWVVRDIDMMSE